MIVTVLVSGATARRMFGLVEPIGLIPYVTGEPAGALMALGLRGYWDTYFAGRAAPLGRAPAQVVHAVFYNFAPGEAARHIPRVWDIITPEAALAARQEGCVTALRRLLGGLAEEPGLARTAGLLAKAAISAPVTGRPLYAGLRALPLPADPAGLLWHAANLLREHRGDGHVAALVANQIGGTQSHVLHALSQGQPAQKFGRLCHLPPAQLAAVTGSLRGRGLIGADGWLTAQGRAVKQRIEALTDDLAAPPYNALQPSELDQLITGLQPLATTLTTALDAAGPS